MSSPLPLSGGDLDEALEGAACSLSGPVVHLPARWGAGVTSLWPHSQWFCLCPGRGPVCVSTDLCSGQPLCPPESQDVVQLWGQLLVPTPDLRHSFPSCSSCCPLCPVPDPAILVIQSSSSCYLPLLSVMS